MNKNTCLLGAASVALLLFAAPLLAADENSDLRTSYKVDRADLGPSGTNPYIVIQPGYRLRYKGADSTLTSTVLDETKKIDGVETRIIEEREEADGDLIEKIRNYVAIDKKTGDLYFFGQDVTSYDQGEPVDHDGSWQAGKEDARFGLLMPGDPKVGERFQQEDSPGVAEDRCEIVAIGDEVTVPAGSFKKCLRTRDTSALEQGASKRVYAPGVGMVLDDDYELASIDKPNGDRRDDRRDDDHGKSDTRNDDKSRNDTSGSKHDDRRSDDDNKNRDNNKDRDNKSSDNKDRDSKDRDGGSEKGSGDSKNSDKHDDNKHDDNK